MSMNAGTEFIQTSWTVLIPNFFFRAITSWARPACAGNALRTTLGSWNFIIVAPYPLQWKPPFRWTVTEEDMQVVVRSLEVLRILARSPKGMTLGEISDRLDLPVASAHRTAAVLERERFITRSATNRRYFLGPAVLELVQSDYSRESPLVTAHKAVAEASRLSGETVFLSEFSGDKVVCLALSESRYPLRLYVRVGQTMPLHAAAAARTLLAWQQPETVQKLLSNSELTPFTPDTPSTINAVMDHLAAIRATGYDICESELDENVWAVSAPVRSSTGQVVASITLASPTQRMARADIRDEAVRLTLAAAHEMASDLGYEEPET